MRTDSADCPHLRNVGRRIRYAKNSGGKEVIQEFIARPHEAASEKTVKRQYRGRNQTVCGAPRAVIEHTPSAYDLI